jgi:hypothetical protein
MTISSTECREEKSCHGAETRNINYLVRNKMDVVLV